MGKKNGNGPEEKLGEVKSALSGKNAGLPKTVKKHKQVR